MITDSTLPWMLVAGLGGVVVTMLGFWAKSQLERIGGVETKVERTTEQTHDRELTQADDLATIKANVVLLMTERTSHNYAQMQAQLTMLMEDSRRCDELAERTARLEAFQVFAEQLLERAVKGLERAIEFEARFGEQLTTLFKGVGALTTRLERLAALTPAGN